MSEQPKHTPGPWHCQHESKYQTQGTRVYKQWGNAGNQQLVADASAHDENSDECLANARLIAAAPDLLAACEAVYAAFGLKETLPLGFPPELELMLKDAIAKAKGDPTSVE